MRTGNLLSHSDLPLFDPAQTRFVVLLALAHTRLSQSQRLHAKTTGVAPLDDDRRCAQFACLGKENRLKIDFGARRPPYCELQVKDPSWSITNWEHSNASVSECKI